MNSTPSTTMPPPEATNQPPAYSKARIWSVTFMVALFATINWADKAVIGIVAQSMIEELHFTPTQIGFAGSAFFFLYSISGILVGFLGDRFKIQWILFVLAAVWGAVQFPILVVGTFAVLLATRIVLGAAEGPAAAMATATLFQWYAPEKRGFPSALVSAGASFAKIAAAPLLALVLAGWGWRACFVVMGMASVVWCLAWWFVGKEGPYAHGKNQKRFDQRDRLPLRSIILSRSFMGSLIGSFLVYGLVAASITWIPSYFEKGLGFSRLQSGMMFGLPSIAALVGMFGATMLADKLATKGFSGRTTRGLFTMIFLLIGGMALAVLPYIAAPKTVVALLIIGYGCAVVAVPMTNTIISQITPASQIASALGIFIAVQNSSGLITPTLVGYLVDHAPTVASGYALAYQIMGIAVIIGGLVIGWLVNPERDAALLKAQLENQKSQG